MHKNKDSLILVRLMRYTAVLGQNSILVNICDALRDLVPFVQFKKREKHLWKSVDFSKLQAEACKRVVTLEQHRVEMGLEEGYINLRSC